MTVVCCLRNYIGQSQVAIGFYSPASIQALFLSEGNDAPAAVCHRSKHTYVLVIRCDSRQAKFIPRLNLDGTAMQSAAFRILK